MKEVKVCEAYLCFFCFFIIFAPRINLFLIMTTKGFFSFKENKFFWLNIIGMIAAIVNLIYIVLYSLDIYTRHGHSIQVPELKNLSVAEAQALVQKQELQCAVIDSDYVKTLAPGIILEQNPQAGAKVKQGRTVYLTINSLSTPLRVLPDVADNSSYRQAQAKLTASGFKLTEPELIAGEKDWVYGVKYKGQEQENGAQIPLGATLTLIVGNGSNVALNDSIAETEGMSTETPTGSHEAVVDDSWF